MLTSRPFFFHWSDLCTQAPCNRSGHALQGLTRPPSAEPIGVQLWRLGAGLVGRKVMRYWPDEGGWWEAEVKEASPRMAKFR